MMFRTKLTISLAAVFLLATTFNQAARAEQRVAADEYRPQKANISKNSISRIAIDGGRIAEVKWSKDELELNKEPTTGQIFVRATTNRSTNLYVISENGHTYQLLLSPKAENGDSIIIDYQGKLQAQSSRQALMPRPPVAVSHKSGSYEQAIKQLLVSMMNGSANEYGIREDAAYNTVPLWENTLFVKTKQYAAADMKAEVYNLTNTGSGQMTIREQEFYRPGVYAVAARKHVLAPGEMTEVFVVRSLGSN